MNVRSWVRMTAITAIAGLAGLASNTCLAGNGYYGGNYGASVVPQAYRAPIHTQPMAPPPMVQGPSVSHAQSQAISNPHFSMANSHAMNMGPMGHSQAFAAAQSMGGNSSSFSNAFSSGPGGQSSSAFSNSFSMGGMTASFSNAMSFGPQGVSHSASHSISGRPQIPAMMPSPAPVSPHSQVPHWMR